MIFRRKRPAERVVLTVNVQAPVRDIAREVRREILLYQRRNGGGTGLKVR